MCMWQCWANSLVSPLWFEAKRDVKQQQTKKNIHEYNTHTVLVRGRTVTYNFDTCTIAGNTKLRWCPVKMTWTIHRVTHWHAVYRYVHNMICRKQISQQTELKWFNLITARAISWITYGKYHRPLIINHCIGRRGHRHIPCYYIII